MAPAAGGAGEGRGIARRQAVEKRLELLAAHLLEILDLTFSYNWHFFFVLFVRR